MFALFGIENDSVGLAVNLLVFFLVVIWLALVYFTYADARRRIEDPLLVGCAVAAALFPFVGTIVYLIIRPPEYLEDVRERELEIRAAEARIHAVDYQECPHCHEPVEPGFLRCPHCTRKLREPCGSCGKPIDPRWKLCPFCETPVRRRVAPRRKRTAAARSQRAAKASQRGTRAKPAAPRERTARPVSSPRDRTTPQREAPPSDTASSPETVSPPDTP